MDYRLVSELHDPGRRKGKKSKDHKTCGGKQKIRHFIGSSTFCRTVQLMGSINGADVKIMFSLADESHSNACASK